ncbi:sigma-E factor negative regulatory protein [Nevskia sp.]|uniref:sigma-E factor negative regulatory protein n=1 Tax=Nevskia sp. TaxID=1929292 RepID=UPI0025D06462|nr:sigma-E factor negative regulatory protein [Nevskia sp.]
MSEELLSALLDGECTPAEVEEVLAAIDRSPALKARWSRMCASRDARAGVSIAKPAFDFAAGVMAALDEVPAESVNPKVVPLRPRAVATKPASLPAAAVSVRSLRWQRFAGLAVAASITGVVAISGRNLLDRPIASDSAATLAQVTADAGGNPDIVKVNANGEIVSTADQDAVLSAQLDDETASKLTGYIIEHINSPARAGMGGALGYTRIVAQPGSYASASGSN